MGPTHPTSLFTHSIKYWASVMGQTLFSALGIQQWVKQSPCLVKFTFQLRETETSIWLCHMLWRKWRRVKVRGALGWRGGCHHISVNRSVVSNSLRLDSSLPGCSVYGILWARMLEWVAIPFSKGSSQPRDQVSCIAGGFFTVCTTREAPGEPSHRAVTKKLSL